MLQVEAVTKSFGNLPVLRGVSLSVDRGEIVCLLGPSGCGKTTLLRVIAGLEPVDSGRVLLNGKSLEDVPVHERGFGLMFQDFALFPHLNVANNVAFGLKMQRETGIAERVGEVLRLVGMGDFEKRDIHQLSGGERQRVALARSLAPNPPLLMLDEPLGSLDANLRERLAVELRRIIKEVNLAAIYVTHDQSEAFAIADRIAVMNAGNIEQVEAPQSLYLRPSTTFVAQFLGLNNIVPVKHVVSGTVVTVLGRFTVAGGAQSLLLHPLGIHLAVEDTPETVSGQVVECLFQGDSYRLTVACEDDVELVFEVSAREAAVPDVGDNVQLTIDPEMIVPLAKSMGSHVTIR